MKNPDVILSGAVADALLHLQALSNDHDLREIRVNGSTRIPFRTLLALAIQHLQRALHPHSTTSAASLNGTELAERCLAVIHAALQSVAHSEDYRSSLSARVGFDHLIDQVETAAADLRKRGDVARLLDLIGALDRETGALRAN